MSLSSNTYNGQLISSVTHPVGTYNFPLTTMIDYNGGTVPVYVGYAIPGSSTASPLWAIQYITYDGNNNTLSTQWSPNYSSFGDIWTNRAGLTYS